MTTTSADPTIAGTDVPWRVSVLLERAPALPYRRELPRYLGNDGRFGSLERGRTISVRRSEYRTLYERGARLGIRVPTPTFSGECYATTVSGVFLLSDADLRYAVAYYRRKMRAGRRAGKPVGPYAQRYSELRWEQARRRGVV